MRGLIILIAAISLWADGKEIPIYTDTHTIIKHSGFTLEYAEKYEQARWVAYVLDRAKLNGTISRTNNFRPDPLVKKGSSTLTDYKHSGFDRGHLAPAADFKYSRQAMSETFFMNNISPQRPSFNRGIWSRLESTVRNFARDKDTIYIVTAGILEDSLPTIGNNVAIPKEYFKAILKYNDSIHEGIGFILKNEGSKLPLNSFVVSIDSIESRTNIDFFTVLPDSIENHIERTVNLQYWNLDTITRK